MCIRDSHSDAAPPRGHEGGGVVDDALPDARAPGVEPQGPGDDLREGGLSGAVVPDDGGDEARAQPRVHRPTALMDASVDVDGNATRGLGVRGDEAVAASGGQGLVGGTGPRARGREMSADLSLIHI